MFDYNLLLLAGCFGSFRFDPKLLEDWPPFLGIDLYHRCQVLRRPPFARERFGSVRAATATALRFAMISRDVPFGAKKPAHSVYDRAGNPISAKAGCLMPWSNAC